MSTAGREDNPDHVPDVRELANQDVIPGIPVTAESRVELEHLTYETLGETTAVETSLENFERSRRFSIALASIDIADRFRVSRTFKERS